MLESRQNKMRKTKPSSQHVITHVAHNYSTQTLNSTAIATDLIRQQLDRVGGYLSDGLTEIISWVQGRPAQFPVWVLYFLLPS